MSVRNLEFLFRPRSVALIGASARAHSVGNAVLCNLLAGGFKGEILPVNPKYDEVEGVRCWRDIGSLPSAPELAVVCTPPQTLPSIVEEVGHRGTRAVVILTAGLDASADGGGQTILARTLAAAGARGVRLLGPNCLGLVVPPIGLNASFAPGMVPAGKLAFVSQSGALATAVADWACSQAIGFSHFVSLGNSADIDFGDLLDYLGGDAATQAILLYIESVKHARKFMSAARAAARNKPVIVVKAGRTEAAKQAASSHTGALAGSDRVYDAAIRRAGLLRVDTTEELFNAVESLARGRMPAGNRLAVVTNGGGPGVMAMDALREPCVPATLAEATVARLDTLLPPTWSRANPVDLIGDAPPERYREAVEVLLDDRGIDGLVFIHAPTAIVPADTIAAALVPVLQGARIPVHSCWMGGQAVAGARQAFAAAGLPAFESPEDAVRAFGQRVEFHTNQELLTQTPAMVLEPPNSVSAARAVIDQALASGREWLTEPEAKRVLAAFGIPVVETRVAANGDEAAAAANALGYPVVLKILSPTLTHKSDVGGVQLGISTETELREAVAAMDRRIRKLRPGDQIDGFTVQPMIDRPHPQELIAGASEDPVFGPVILFGHGGTAVEAIADRAIGLPPLNGPLAADLVARTRVARLLAGYRDRPPADQEAIVRTLVQIGQLVIDLSNVVELDINPLLADEHGVLALDARIRVAAGRHSGRRSGTARLAILPYPVECEEPGSFAGHDVLLRPIRPEDEPAHARFLAHLEPDDVRFRFFGLVREFPHSQLARYTQIDYDREMAFVASRVADKGEQEILGVVRIVIVPGRQSAEFAIVIRSDIKGLGLGGVLLEKMIRYCRDRGLEWLHGQALAGNQRMLDLASRLGFELGKADEGVVDLRLRLR